jgi:hypothetical protein
MGNWQVYRASKPLIDPVTKENLGYEVMYGGDAVVDKLGDEIQTMHLTKVNSEILVGDRLIKAPRTSLSAMCHIARMAISGADHLGVRRCGRRGPILQRSDQPWQT